VFEVINSLLIHVIITKLLFVYRDI